MRNRKKKTIIVSEHANYKENKNENLRKKEKYKSTFENEVIVSRESNACVNIVMSFRIEAEASEKERLTPRQQSKKYEQNLPALECVDRHHWIECRFSRLMNVPFL